MQCAAPACSCKLSRRPCFLLPTARSGATPPTRTHTASRLLPLQHLERDKSWIHFGETMADLIVRESLEALAVGARAQAGL